MSKRLTILCEDTQQEVVIRRWLKSKGIEQRGLRVQKNPAGRGAGEHYVRSQYPLEVKECRRQSTFSPVGPVLITLIDADTLSVNQRQQQLDDSLVADGQEKRKAADRIAVLTPKRNIETWVHFMRDNLVDEETEYTKLQYPSDCEQDVKRFVEKHPEQPPTTSPSSLQIAYQELRRIL